MAEVFFKECVDTQDRVFLSLWLDYIPHHQSPHVPAVFEVARVDCVHTHFVENLPFLVPGGKHIGGIGGDCASNKLVLVVFLGSPDHAVLHYLLNHLNYFRFRHGYVDDQAFAVG